MSSSSAVAHQHQHHHPQQGGGSGLVPLAALIKEDARTERCSGGGGDVGSRICARDEDVGGSGAGGEAAEEEARRQRPLLRYGCAAQSKKGEDFFLLRTDCPRPSTSASSSVASPYPTFAVFAVSQTSGTTATFVIIDGWTITVASVGLENNITIVLPCYKIGPLRCWPGGLCLSRSIGDIDVGEFIVPVPYVKQVKLSNAGGRLIIASDGIWDALSSEGAAKSCRGLPAELAAKQVVKEALRTRGLKDDTTCIVVDIIPPGQTMRPPSPPKKMNKLKSLIFRKKAKEPAQKLNKQHSGAGVVEEIFEEGSAMLSESYISQSVTHHIMTAMSAFRASLFCHCMTSGLNIDQLPTWNLLMIQANLTYYYFSSSTAYDPDQI
ncbi:hypothetical protein HU200_018890 [Digitaria exilis]|uniref:protein-serine/threonine phosphatase n=1 Tax=Digitaria exilis TaxID=1010633 RepID=A0A835F401_9POAL|nr:hypothetical protein HU200_018890 [Digitaria exilis]